MKTFLTRLKVIDHFTLEIEIERSVFVKRLKQSVDTGDTGVIFSFEAFASSKNEYRGSVGEHEFEIRRRRKLFDRSGALAIAKGILRLRDSNLIIETEVNSFHKIFIPFYIFMLLFYMIFFIVSLTVGTVGGLFPLLAFPVLLIHAAFMLGLPYMFMRRSTQKMKYDLEREFYFIAGNASKDLG